MEKIKKKMYFYNVGVKFDIHDKQQIYNVWNCNGNCCKSDLANGLSCEDWGVYFNKRCAVDYAKNYVKSGINQTYGYVKEIIVELEQSDWEEIRNYLITEYGYEKEEINKLGFIPWDFGNLLEEICPNWEEPTISYYKNDKGNIEKDTIHVCKEEDIDKNIMKYINEEIYGIKAKKGLVQEESKNESIEEQYSIIYYITEKDFENNNTYKPENTYKDLEEAKKDLNSIMSSKDFFAGKIIDKQTKNEKYCIYEEQKKEKYKYIIKCSLVSDREEFKDQYLLVKNPNELDTQFEIDLTGDFCFNCSFEVVNPKLVKIINSKDELLEFCNQLNIPVSRDYIREDGFLASGTDGLLINNNLEAVDWLENLEDGEEI